MLPFLPACRETDLEVNPVREKKLSNVRSSGADERIVLTPPRLMTLEDAIGWVGGWVGAWAVGMPGWCLCWRGPWSGLCRRLAPAAFAAASVNRLQPLPPPSALLSLTPALLSPPPPPEGMLGPTS